MKKIAEKLPIVVAYGVLAMLAIAPTQLAIEVRDGTYLSAVDPVVWGLFGLLAICIILRRVKIRWPSLFACLFVLMVALSAIKASDRMAAMKELFQAVEYFVLAYMLCVYLLSDAKRRAAAVYLFAGMGTLIVVIAAVQYFRADTPLLDVSGTFGNRNVLGGYLALLLPMLAGLMIYEKNRIRLAWYAVTLVAGLMLTLSGGAMMGVLLGLGLVAMLRGRLAFGILAVGLLLGALLVVPHLPRENALVLSESVQCFDADGEVTRRYTEWQAAIWMAEENPLLGVGAGNYQDNIGMYYGILPDPTGATEPDIQNMYLVVASSVGLIGLIALLGMLCRSIVSAGKAHFQAGDVRKTGVAAGAVGALVAFAIAGIWSPMLVRGLSIPFVFILALADSANE